MIKDTDMIVFNGELIYLKMLFVPLLINGIFMKEMSPVFYLQAALYLLVYSLIPNASTCTCRCRYAALVDMPLLKVQM